MFSEEIGGYPGLELDKYGEYHVGALSLNTARNCLEYLIHCRDIRKVYIPYYTCEVLLEPLHKCGTTYEFYHIDQYLSPVGNFHLENGDFLLYTNYFGLMQEVVVKLYKKYGDKLIVDNAQSFYSSPIGNVATFYSARKFFGVSDGAYLYSDNQMKANFERDISYNRMSYLLKRMDVDASFGFGDFHNAEDSLIGQPIKWMSKITHRLLESIEYEKVKECRLRNYDTLHSELSQLNDFVIELSRDTVPMVYPFLTSNPKLRAYLIKNRVFVPYYWPNVKHWCNSADIEYHLAENLLALPIDQRYGTVQMKRIIKLIKSFNE